MRKDFTKVLSTLLTLVFLCGCHVAAQSKINPAIQINWPFVTGIGNPTSQSLACNATNYGQPYQDISVTPNVSYTCGTTGWQVNASGGGSAPVGQQYHLSGYVGSGSGASTTLSQLNYTTDSTFSDMLGLRNLSTTGAITIAATDPTSNSAVPADYHSIAETTNYTLNSPGVNDISRTVIFGGPGGKNYGAGNGPGNGVTGTPWTNSGNMYMNATFNRRGITQWLSGNATKYGTGDFGGIYLYPTCAGGLTGTSDEGCTAISLRYGQTNYTFSGTAASSASTGTTSLAHTAGQTCDGCYWVDQKTSYASGHFTAAATAATGYYYYSEPIDTTVTPSTAYGNLACQGGLPELAVQTTPELVTCNVTNILGSTGVFTAGSTVTLSGGWTEQVTIVSPGTLSGTTQSGITFYHRNPNITNWAPGAYQLKTTIDDGTYIQAVSVAGTSGSTAPTWNHTVGGTTVDGGVTWTNIRASSTSSISMLWQGGPQGMVQCQDYLLAVSGKAMCEPVFGAPDSTHLAAGLNIGGALATPQTGIFASQALNTLTVSGTTVTGIPNTSTLGPSFNSLTSVLISGCSDATLNGIGTNAVYNVNGTVSWTYPGGSTLLGCPSASINLPSSYAAFHMYPYAEQISPYDGTVNSTLEPNNVAWASGDPLIQPNPPSWSGAGIWQTSTINNTSAGTNSSSMLLDGVGAGISNGYTFIHTRNLNPESMYAGAGGVLTAPVLMNLYGPNSGISITEPLPGSTALSFNCRITGCNNLPVQIMFVGGNTNGSMSFNPLTGSWSLSPTISSPNMTVTQTATLANAAISNMAVTGTATYSAGLTISNTDSQVRWLTFNTGSNVNSFGLCSRYSSGFDDMCFGASNDTVTGLYAATGNVWGNSFHGNAMATFNGIQSSLGAPIFSLAPVYTGTAGVMTATYGLQAVAPLGTTIVGASRTITLLGTLGGSNSVNIPCPTALQAGYPTGTTYILWKLVTGGTTGINLGTCALGTSVVDNGSLTTVVTLPSYSASEPIYAGRIVDTELGLSTAPVCTSAVTGQLTNVGCATGGTTTWATITGGTNTNVLIVGSGGSLSATGTGTITATSMPYSGLTGSVPTWNQNTTGTSANLSGTPALPNGTTATTQAHGDNSTALATDAFVLANAGSGSGGTNPTTSGIQMWSTTTNQWSAASFTDVQSLLSQDTANNTAYGFATGTGGDSTLPTPISGRDYIGIKSGILQKVYGAGSWSPLFVLSCQPGLGDGLNVIPVGTYPQTTCKNMTQTTWTITAISCYADTGTSTCNVTNGAGTSLLTGAITGTSSFAAGTQSSTVTIAPGDVLHVTFAPDGTSTKQMMISVSGVY